VPGSGPTAPPVANEVSGAQSVRDAIEQLGANRILHGAPCEGNGAELSRRLLWALWLWYPACWNARHL
jgi:hypothetical protein